MHRAGARSDPEGRGSRTAPDGSGRFSWQIQGQSKSTCCAGLPVTEIIPNDKDAVRVQVSKAYANAVTLSVKESGNACCSNTLPVGIAAQTAGYSDGETGEYSDAAQSSFGCGNPLAFAGVKEGQTVLDLGSGAGLDVLLAGRKVGPGGKVIGVDMTDAMIEVARDNINRAGADNIEVRKGVIEELPVEDASVDWVISNCVINLSPQKEKVFSEIARVLKPGGPARRTTRPGRRQGSECEDYREEGLTIRRTNCRIIDRILASPAVQQGITFFTGHLLEESH